MLGGGLVWSGLSDASGGLVEGDLFYSISMSPDLSDISVFIIMLWALVLNTDVIVQMLNCKIFLNLRLFSLFLCLYFLRKIL